MWENVIVLLIITGIVAGALAKIIIDKKNGVQCSGCPCSQTCTGKETCPSQAAFGLMEKSHGMKD